MKTVEEYIQEARALPKELQDRNSSIDFDKILMDGITKRFSDAKEKKEQIQTDIIDVIKSKKTFSLGSMVDNSSLPAGWIKYGIELAKKEIEEKGYGKTSNVGPSQSRAQKIDSFLSQKWISK